MRKLLVIALATCIATGAFANVYYSTAASKGAAWTSAWIWHDLADESAEVPVPAANDGHIWVLEAAAKLTGTPTLPDTTWLWGSNGGEGLPAKCSYAQSCNALVYTIPHCTVYGCAVYCNSTGTLALNGDFTFVACGQDFKIYASSGGADDRHVTFDTDFKATAGSDVVIKIPSKTGPNRPNHATFKGDFSAFKGKFAISRNSASTGVNTLILLSPTAMGDTSYPRTDAFTLDHFCKLAIGPDVVQSAARGITFNLKADETAYIGTTGGKETDESTVTTPLYGSVGTLVKEDAGTVTIAGPMEMKNVVVREGTLKLAKTATLADDLTVSVEEGAVLYLTPDRIGKVTTTGAGEVLLDPIELEYHAKTETDPAYTIPVTLADGFDPKGAAIAILLNPALPLPLNETNRLAVVQIPHGKLTADDFVYANAKTCDLPTTWFETETDGTGLQTVYLVARPAIGQTTRNISTTGTTIWTDGQAIHSGADYFNIYGVDTETFADNTRLGAGTNGKDMNCSVVENWVVKGRYIYDYMRSFSFGTLCLHAGAGIQIIYGPNAVSDAMYRHVEGMIKLDESADEDDPVLFCLSTSTPTYTDNDLRADISGAGSLKIYSSKPAEAKDPATPATLKVTGDNSRLMGRFLVNGDTYSVLVAITNAAALGGSPETLDRDGVYLYAKSLGFAILRAEETMTFDSATRGWRLDHCALRVVKDKTLTIKSPVWVTANFVKDGAGTLAFGDDVGISEGVPCKCVVREGFVQATSPNSFAAIELSFAELTDGGISVDAASADADYQAKGLMAETLTFADEGVIKVAVANWTKEMAYLTRAVVTVPAGGPDLSNRLVPTKVRGATVTVLDPVVNEDGSTTYRVAIEPSGLSVILM